MKDAWIPDSVGYEAECSAKLKFRDFTCFRMGVFLEIKTG